MRSGLRRLPKSVPRRALHTRRYAKKVPVLTYTDDVDLNKKLAEWERFYNLDRPHGAFEGKTSYEALCFVSAKFGPLMIFSEFWFKCCDDLGRTPTLVSLRLKMQRKGWLG
jgi:hypothetical protein